MRFLLLKVSAEHCNFLDCQIVPGHSTTTSGERHTIFWTVYLTYVPPEEQIQSIIIEVLNLTNMGILNQSQGTAFITKLEAAGRLPDKGDIPAVCNLLDAFINQVAAYMNAGVLSETEGQSFIDSPNSPVSQLCN